MNRLIVNCHHLMDEFKPFGCGILGASVWFPHTSFRPSPRFDLPSGPSSSLGRVRGRVVMATGLNPRSVESWQEFESPRTHTMRGATFCKRSNDGELADRAEDVTRPRATNVTCAGCTFHTTFYKFHVQYILSQSIIKFICLTCFSVVVQSLCAELTARPSDALVRAGCCRFDLRTRCRFDDSFPFFEAAAVAGFPSVRCRRHS